MGEQELIKKRLRGLDPERERLFRINAGMGWSGEILRREKTHIVLGNPRPLHAAPSGWPDLCGWETVEITPEMVGEKIAVFVGEEMKFSGSLRPNQRRFRDMLLRMGGIHRVVRS
jgi:hypothetical protein